MLLNLGSRRALDGLKLQPWFWAFLLSSTELMTLNELPNSVESCRLAVVAGTPRLGQNALS